MSVSGSLYSGSSYRPGSFVYNSQVTRSLASTRPISRGSPGSSRKSSGRGKEGGGGGDDENMSINSDVSSARQDLMTLGIDLDEGLIQRMKSLGINKVFEAANKNVDLVKSRQKITPGAAPEIVFRHNDDITENTRETESTMRPWEPFAVDAQRLSVILKEISNSQGGLDPSIRASIDSMIQHFRIQYSRDNGRFVRCMLGLPSKQQSKIEPEDIQRLILKTRFVDANKFEEMIGRIHISASPNQVSSLFTILSETKVFGGEKVVIVDLWLFLSLLRTASDESRRSYDCKTTKLASDVEFWQKSNNDVKEIDSGKRKTSKNVLYHEKHRYFKGEESCALLEGREGNYKESSQEKPATQVGPPTMAELFHSKHRGKPPNVVVGKYFEEGVNETDVAAALNKEGDMQTVFRCRSTLKNKTSHPRTKMTEEYATEGGARGSSSPEFSQKKHNRYDRGSSKDNCWSSVFNQPEKLYLMDGISLSALFSQQKSIEAGEGVVSTTSNSNQVRSKVAAGDSNRSSAATATATATAKTPSHFDELVGHIGKSKAASLNFKMSSHILERETTNKCNVADALGYDNARVIAGIQANPDSRVNPQLLSFGLEKAAMAAANNNPKATRSNNTNPTNSNSNSNNNNNTVTSPRADATSSRYANRPKDSISSVIHGN